jgi:hypothetical protein
MRWLVNSRRVFLVEKRSLASSEGLSLSKTTCRGRNGACAIRKSSFLKAFFFVPSFSLKRNRFPTS